MGVAQIVTVCATLLVIHVDSNCKETLTQWHRSDCYRKRHGASSSWTPGLPVVCLFCVCTLFHFSIAADAFDAQLQIVHLAFHQNFINPSQPQV